MPGSGGLPPGGGPDSGSTPSSGGQARPSSGKAKRLFMSGKASQVHTTTKPAEHGKIAAKADDPRGNFADLLREVETLGATGLDKAAKKKIDAERLKSLNARPEARQAMSARMGLGMARKQAERDKKELQQAIDTGMVQSKGLGKKKRRLKDQERRSNLGLVEDGGAFRKGVLDLNKLPGGSMKGRMRKKSQKRN